MTPDSPACTHSSLEWAGLIISIVAINVSWWLFDVPLIWKHSWKHYLNSVMWQCFRLYMPGIAAIYAIRMATSCEEQPFIYYTGTTHDASSTDQPSRLSKFKYTKALLTDSVTIVATGITLSTAVHSPVGTNISGFNSSLRSYPSLPVAVWGLWLILCSHLRWKSGWAKWAGFLVVICVGLALALPLALASPEGRSSSIWFPALIGYIIMGLPILAYSFRVAVVAEMFVVIIRVGGIGIGACTPMAYFPFCQLKGKAFGVTYLLVGSIGGLIALCGLFNYLYRILNENRQSPSQGTELR
jgi:hypothetical protein